MLSVSFFNFFKKKIFTNSYILVFYGFISSCILMLPQLSVHINSDWYMGCLIELLQSLIDDFTKVAYWPETGAFPHGEIPYAAFLAFVCKILHIHSASHAYFYAQWVSCFMLIAFYPLIIFIFCKSIRMALITPLLLKFLILPYIWENHSVAYWMSAWILVIGMPLLVLFFKDKKNIPLAFIIAFLCGFSNFVRSASALPIVVPFFAIILFDAFKSLLCENFKSKPAWKLLGITLVKIMFLYFCAFKFGDIVYFVCTFIYNILAYQSVPLFCNSYTAPWHSLYIGLGWHENPFGIIYLDECAASKAYELNPGCHYGLKDYMDTLRTEYFRLFFENKLYFISDYIKKAFIILKNYFFGKLYRHLFFSCLILSFSSVLLLKRVNRASLKSIFRFIVNKLSVRYIFCFFVILALCLLPPMISIPLFGYSLGVCCCAGMLVFVFICIVLSALLYGQNPKDIDEVL